MITYSLILFAQSPNSFFGIKVKQISGIHSLTIALPQLSQRGFQEELAASAGPVYQAVLVSVLENCNTLRNSTLNTSGPAAWEIKHQMCWLPFKPIQMYTVFKLELCD